mgnify:CR=1 FL=1
MKREKKQKKQRRTLDMILGIVYGSTAAFTVAMIIIFIRCGAVPDTLIQCWFGAVFGEISISGWIKTTKEKKSEIKDREGESL